MSLVELAIEVPQAAVRSPQRQTLRRLVRHRLALTGMIILGLLATGGVLAPLLASEHPNAAGIWSTSLREARAAPSLAHPLGTDQLGRDMWSRMLYGARVSLLLGFASVTLAVVIGTLLGAFAGYSRGFADGAIMRLMDIMLAFPSVLLALAIVVLAKPLLEGLSQAGHSNAIIGSITRALPPGLLTVMLAVGIISIPTYARIVRGAVLSEAMRDYVAASRALGAGHRRVLFGHVLPNSLSPLIVAASLGIGTAILEAAALGFLGLGAQPPLAEWGLMLSDNRQKLFSEWWLVAAPGIAIMLTVLGFNLLGDGLRDVLDPRLRHR
jgi:ABC-type dipeptide/oligopeptide/nickel transport system permease subunit